MITPCHAVGGHEKSCFSPSLFRLRDEPYRLPEFYEFDISNKRRSQKWELYFVEPEVKCQWIVLVGYLTMSTKC